MLITKKRVMNPNMYIMDVPDLSQFRLMSKVNHQTLGAAGFPSNCGDGVTVLPAIKGAVSRYNAEGKSIPDKSRDKESRYMRTVYWEWTEMHGDTPVHRSDFKDIYRECWPRVEFPPPAVELTYVDHPEHGPTVVSPVLMNTPERLDNIKHAINLMLELFGECETVNEQLQGYVWPTTTRMNWKFLPPGEHPWDRLKASLEGSPRFSDNLNRVVMDRMETLRGYGPDAVYVGTGGFADYVGYSFQNHNIVVLECVRIGNAMYVFGKDWQSVSQLTKREIITRGLHLERIVHTIGWKARITHWLTPVQSVV